MSKATKSHARSFILEGEFLGFVFQKDQPKYLQIATAQGKLNLKLSKKTQKNLSIQLKSNQIIQIVGKSELKGKPAKVNLKVVQINPIPETTLPISSALPKKVKLLLCQKSGCQKKGSEKQRQAIERNLEARGLSQAVTIQETGCLGKCSMAPNVMLMPGKKRLSGMKPNAIADLLANNQNN
jgi:hypothetical protein